MSNQENTYVPDPVAQAEQSGKDLAIASLAVSISCIFMTLGLFSFIGSIIGHKALNKLNSVGNTSHKGFATAGIIVGYVATGLAVLGLIAFFFFLAFFLSDSYY